MKRAVRFVLSATVSLATVWAVTLISGRAETPMVQLCCSNIPVNPSGAFSTYLTVAPTAPTTLRVVGRVRIDDGLDLGEVTFGIPAQGSISQNLTFQNPSLTNGGSLELTGFLQGPAHVALGGLTKARLAPPLAVWFSEPYTVDISDNGVVEVMAYASEHAERFRVALRQINGERRDGNGQLLDLFREELEFPANQTVLTWRVPNLASEAEFILEAPAGVLVDSNRLRAIFQPPSLHFNNALPKVPQGRSVIVEVIRGGDPVPALSVDFQTRDISAKAGIDFAAKSGTLKFVSGERTRKIQIDLLHEVRETDLDLTFALDLSNAVNATLLETSGLITYARTVRLLADNYTVDSNGDVTLGLSVSPPPPRAMDLTLSFPTENSGAMYQYIRAPAGQSEFSQKISMGKIVVPFTVGLDVFPGNTDGFSTTVAVFPSSAEIRPDDWKPEMSAIRVTSSRTFEGYPAYFHLERLGGTNESLELSYSTKDITARAGIDYVAASGLIRFAVGVDTVDLSVDTLTDALNENVKEFSLEFRNVPPNVRVLLPPTSKIVGTGAPYYLYGTSVAEGSGNATLSLSTYGSEISFSYSTVEGTAKAGLDFTPVSGRFTNVTSAAIEIPILNDSEVEAPESFTLNIVETAPERRTNSFEIIIFDDEIPLNHDSSFNPPEFGNYISTGRVLEDDRIVLVEWPYYLDLLDKNGHQLSRTPIAAAPVSWQWAPLSVTPEAELLVNFSAHVVGEPGLVRIKGEGQVDTSFRPALPEGWIAAAASGNAGETYVAMTTVPPGDWIVYRLKHDGSRDDTFAPVQAPGWGDQVGRLSLIGAETLEIITYHCQYRYCDYFRVLSRNGMVVDKRFSPANYEAPEFLQETYVGESGQKIVSKFDTPFGGIVYRRNADGSIDSSLKTGRLDGLLTYIGTQSDGKVIFVDSAAAGVRVVRIGPGTIMETNLVEMQSTYYIGSEADGAFQVELLRAGDSSKPISVWAKPQDGTAQAGLDYEPLDYEITFAPYEVVKKVPIRILQDSLVEGDENFTLKISEPAVGTMVLESIVSLTLIDDDRIELQLYQEWDGQWVVYADNQTGRNIELQSSDDGARTWEKAAEPQVYVRMPISFEGRHRFYRAVLRDSSQTCPR